MRKSELLQAVEQNAAAAAEIGQAAIAEAVERLAPYVEQAQDKVAPLADQAAARIRHSAQVAGETLEQLQPRIEHVRDELLTTFLGHAPEPEPVVVAPKKKCCKKFFVFALLAAIAGTVAWVVKKALEPPSEADWVSHTPSDAFIAHPSADVTDDFVPAAESMDAPEGETVAPFEVPAGDAEEPAAAAAEGYGEGSYVGDEPPEGFTIKGNARSKKYHVPGGSHYDRTTAEVWFNSAEAAEAAGFTAAK
ncbi:MAG: hypothetical protein LBR58_10745 [Propionibacteriaceae bacterium]|jgi:hypothetical protein|nr:hypothetical protein [Propionibacteriaceae bacterium]